MNFIKRAGIILMIIAISASSCKKLSDDVNPIISTVENVTNYQYTGVTALVNDISALRYAITSVQTTLSTLPQTPSIATLKTSLTVVAGEIDAIDSNFNKVAMYGTTTKAIFEGLKSDMTSLPSKIAADNTALKTLIAGIGTSNDALKSRLNELVKTNDALVTKVTSVQKSMENPANWAATTQAVIDALSVQLATAQFSFDLLLATYMP